MKKALKIFLWILGSIFLLLAAVVLLLSVFFPSKYVKGIVEDNLRSQLKREVVLNELDFSIFSGITINGLDIKERKLFGTQNSFFKVKSLKVNYKILPLIFQKKFVLSQATINGAEVYVIAKNLNGTLRYNFDDLFQIPAASKEEEKKPVPAEEFDPNKIKKPAMPIEFYLGKVGIEDCKLDYKDYSNSIATLEYTVDKITAVLTDVTSSLSPFGVKGGLQITLNELKKGKSPEKNFNIYTGMEGKIKPFDAKGLLNPDIFMDLKIQNFYLKGSFLQTALDNGIKLIVKDLIQKIDANLPQYTEEIKAKLKPEIDKQLTMLDSKIAKIKENQGLGKQDLLKEKEAQLKDFDQKIEGILNESTAPALKEADKLPEPVKGSAKKEINNSKNSIKTKTRETLSKELDKIIAGFDNESKKQIENIKNAAKGQVDKAITQVIKASADKLKSWSKSLADKGLGLGFLNGSMSFQGGKIPFALKDWKLMIQKMDLMSKDFGMQGDLSYGLFNSKGETQLNVYLPQSFDIGGIFKPFVKNNLIELPLFLTFDVKNKVYTLNKSPLTTGQIKDFAISYAMNYAKDKIGLGGDDASSGNTEKYKKAMTDIKNGQFKSAGASALKTGDIVEKYKKAGETKQKTQDVGKKIKKLF